MHCSDTELVTADSKAKRTPHFITPGRKETVSVTINYELTAKDSTAERKHVLQQ